jgi:hypothetical protein
MTLINARIQSILKRFPDVERIFEWYEIELTEETKLLRLEDACERFQIEAEDIVLDLEEAIQDSRDVDWLGPDDDESQWTEGFTEESGTGNGLSMDDETVDAPTDMTDMEGGSEDYEY